MNIASQDAVSQSAEPSIPAAKLHVLALAPIKNKLGDRWERLSDLVHRLFEKAISSAQGPTDHFVILDELSYVVTFSNLSLAQTNLICASIAREVCEHLFGDKIEEISVRSIVAEIVSPSSVDAAHAGAQIEATLERDGIETVVTHSVQSGSSMPVISVVENRQKPVLCPIERIQSAHSHLAQFGLRLGLFPVWELRRRLCSSLFLTPFTGNTSRSIVSGRLSLGGTTESEIIDLEVGQLNAAAAYAARVRNEQKICAIGVGVSYESLCCFRSRIRYITALQKTEFSPSSPLLLKIEQIPDGAPDGRIAELVTMLSTKNIRVILEFKNLAAIPKIGMRLGAVAIGGTIPSNVDDAFASVIAERVVHGAAFQKGFAFLDHLDTAERAVVADRANIRFGRGVALGRRYFSGLETVPHFPLTCADSH